MTLLLAINGVGGRMGRALTRCISERPDLRLVGGAERPGSGLVGADIGSLAGLGPNGLAASASPAQAAHEAEAWIDFTNPAACLSALEALSAPGPVRAVVIGATGFTPEQEAAVSAFAERFAIVRSGNFSLGVNLMCALVESAARRLGAGWDIEISEAHHRRKADAPSGTALMAGEAAARGRDTDLASVRLPPHDGVGPERPEGGIGFSVVRGGGVFGEHSVAFLSEQEVLRISHTALNREVFAAGALEAALWAGRARPGLYSMRDVLGL